METFTTKSQLTTPTIITTRRKVSNLFPIDDPTPYRIALIGEAPGEEEENYGRPFIGKSGHLLTNTLLAVGIDRNRCFVGNVCQVRPPANNFAAFPWLGEEVQSGIETLYTDLASFNPHIIVTLGGVPLHLFKAGNVEPPQRAGKYIFPHAITAWRGSLFISPSNGKKCISTVHPAFVLRDFSYYPLFNFDLKRAREEGTISTLTLPSRELLTHVDPAVLRYLMDTWPAGLKCAVDIEGGLPLSMLNDKALKKKPKEGQIRHGWPCVSICANPLKAYTIAWGRMNEIDHRETLISFARLMNRRDVPKVLANQLYDNFVLSYGYGIPIRNVSDDIMIKGWEIYSELPRSVSVQASIWTREPHWKDDSMYASNGEGLFIGCARDSAVELEVSNAQDGVLTGSSLIHYHKMLEIQNPFLYMELRGIRYDQAAVNISLSKVQTEMSILGADLESRVGKSMRGPAGAISSKKLAELLYTDLKYPPQYAKGEGGRRTNKLTTDNEALLTLLRHRQSDELLISILRHRYLEGQKETLQITADADGRVRCGYSLEAETGRVRCYTSPTGSGANLQTIQKELRIHYTADPGYDFFQCDLEGADGWTVAAHCARLGDMTMLDDYLAGMKPAKLIALLYWFGPVINKLQRSDLKWLHDHVFPLVKKQAGHWLYLGCKRVQHGSNYLMGIPTMQMNVLRDSYKESGTPIYMDFQEAKTLQALYFSRYPGVLSWHNWAKAKLLADGKLLSASGHLRIFFGRRYGTAINETVKEFLAHEPQNNTTWCTNLAVLNLWNDPTNRTRTGGLYVQCLHQVHDALCGQWPQNCRDEVKEKIHTWFKNTITIAGIPITIPFDGGYGPNWGEATNKI